MSEPETSEPTTGGELQFDHAEFAGPAPSESATATAPICAGCKQAIPDAYFEVNSIILCPRCRGYVEAHLTGGSGLARFARAAVYGAGAAVAGFALYYGVWVLTELQIGLISIVVGFIVGGAVRKGSRGRGGWAYQLLAVFLAYSAIAASYSAVALPLILADDKTNDAPVNANANANAGPNPAATPAPAQDEKVDIEKAGPGVRLLALALWLVFVVALSYALPIIAGTQSPISLLIVAFALWEAWKLNKFAPPRITGPYRVGGAGPGPGPGPGPEAEGAPAHA